jgi:septin family protein
MSKNLAAKQHNNAPIIFLIGTSTSGKSTICNQVVKQDQMLPIGARLDYQSWSLDEERRKIFREKIDQANKIGVELFSGEENFDKLRQKFPPNFLLPAIANGILQDGNKSLNLKNDEDFNKSAS